MEQWQTTMEKQVEQIVANQEAIEGKVDQILTALSGNEISGDKGLVGRMEALERKQIEYEAKQQKVEEFQRRIITIFAVVSALGTLALLLTTVYKNLK